MEVFPFGTEKPAGQSCDTIRPISHPNVGSVMGIASRRKPHTLSSEQADYPFPRGLGSAMQLANFSRFIKVVSQFLHIGPVEVSFNDFKAYGTPLGICGSQSMNESFDWEVVFAMTKDVARSSSHRQHAFLVCVPVPIVEVFTRTHLSVIRNIMATGDDEIAL
jgi:hypothetical protein